MTDLKRLIDEVDSDLARALLRSGRAPSGNPARKKQVLTALGVGLVIGTTNKLSLAALSTWQKVMFIGGVACVGAGGAMTYTHWAAQLDVASVPQQLEAPELTAPVSSRSELVAPSAAASPVAAAAAPVGAPVTASARSNEVKHVRESSVKAELGLLEQARSSLSGGSPSGALQVLSRYNERYPRGSLRLEAEVLKVEALAASGRNAEAARLADRVLARNPKSVVAARLRRFASKD